MKKCLFYGENPVIATGFSQVSRHILPVLLQEYEVDAVLVNFFADMEIGGIPAHLHPFCESTSDKLQIAAIEKHIREDEYDLLFIIMDINIAWGLLPAIQERKSQNARIVCYPAIDCDNLPQEYYQITEYMEIVAFSHYAQQQIKQYTGKDVPYIYHGVDTDVFQPASYEEKQQWRKKYFHIEGDTFLVSIFARNQWRKDIGRSVMAFKLFHAQYPQSKLYIHAAQTDLGGNIALQAKLLGMDLQDGSIVFVPNPFSTSGVPTAVLRQLYCCSDAVISSSQGEGFGLTTIEAMACGVPFIGPDNTTFPELLGKEHDHETKHFETCERGYLVESGGSELFTIWYGLSDLIRPTISTSGMRSALIQICAYPQAALQRAQRARQWVEQYSWEYVQNQWKEILQ
jgi:glycosyltransferase involved in cell wall biosynthesis